VSSLARPRVFLSLGTTYAGLFLERALEALRDFPGGVIVSWSGVPSSAFALADRAERVVYSRFFSNVAAVLRQVDAVVTVAGGKTVMDALREGKPLICLPGQGEQREIALALRAAGAAEIPCAWKWDSTEFSEAVRKVSSEFRYTRAAEVLQAEILAMNGPRAAAEAIENG
jgi:UDP:flavonoid glycosyltransferase YjiC (YdhE family)